MARQTPPPRPTPRDLHQDPDALLREREAAAFLGFSQRALQAWRLDGTGPRYVRISSRAVRYRRRDLLGWSRTPALRASRADGSGNDMDKRSFDEAIYDAISPEWRTARLIGGKERRISAPYRTDRHPSVDINERSLLWIDRATGQGGSAFKLAILTKGEDDARRLARKISRELPVARRTTSRRLPEETSDCKGTEVVDLGPPTSEQIAWLKRDRRIEGEDGLTRLGARLEAISIMCIEELLQ